MRKEWRGEVRKGPTMLRLSSEMTVVFQNITLASLRGRTEKKAEVRAFLLLLSGSGKASCSPVFLSGNTWMHSSDSNLPFAHTCLCKCECCCISITAVSWKWHSAAEREGRRAESCSWEIWSVSVQVNTYRFTSGAAVRHNETSCIIHTEPVTEP